MGVLGAGADAATGAAANTQSVAPRLFWKELIGPEHFRESRIGFWRTYISANYPWIKL